MTTSKSKKTGPPNQQSGLPWPDAYAALLPVIRAEWEISGELYLNRLLGGGLSGAKVYVADLSCRGFKGQAILKLDTANPADWSEDEEFDKHRIAVETTPEYAEEHLPRLLHASRKDNQIAMLSSIAGRGLEYAVPWIECPYAQQLSFGRRVSDDLLEKWNAQYTLADGLFEPQALLENWLDYRLDPEQGRIGAFLTEHGIDPDEPSINFQGEWYPNPYAFARRVVPLPKRTQLRAVRGQSHGDLHGRNILIAAPPRQKRQYFLIDLDLYERDDFLFYDHAYFVFTYLLHSRGEATAAHWKSILDNLARGAASTVEPKGDDVGLIKLIRTIRRTWFGWVDRHEPNRLSNMDSQYLLARVSVGLMFTHRNLMPNRRARAFTYAAANLKDYLKLNGVKWPTNGPTLEFEPEETKSAVTTTARPAVKQARTLTLSAQTKAPSSGLRYVAAAAILLLAIGAGGTYWWQSQTTSSSTAADGIAPPKMEELSIAVLPFRAIGTGTNAQILAHGLQASISNSLDQVPDLVVVWHRLDAAGFTNADALASIGKNLNVRYLLDGSVQEMGDSVRVIANLVDINTGRLLWSKRYDRSTDKVFAIQDEITLEVLVALQVQLTEGLQAAIRGQRTHDLDTFLLYARGQELFRTFTPSAMREVRGLMDEALALDPQFSPARTLKARTHLADARLGYSTSSWQSLVEASKILNEAANVDGTITDAERGEILSADAYLDLLARRYDAAAKSGEKSVDLVPDNADITGRFGAILLYIGDYDRSIRMLKRAMRLSPVYPSWFALVLSRAYVFKGNTREAIKWAKDGLQRAHGPTSRAIAFGDLAFVYAEAGRPIEAKEAAREALEINPAMRISTIGTLLPFKSDDDLQRVANALRTAGFPD